MNPPIRIDAAARRAWHGAHPLPLGEREYGVLATLVANAGHPVTIEDLSQQVWGDERHEPRAIQQVVFVLRTKLGDHRPHIYIQNVRKIGYQFEPSLVTPSTSTRFEVDGQEYVALRWDEQQATDETCTFLVTARPVQAAAR